jgi:glucokinase
MDTKIIIGIDLGGTKIMTGAISAQGKVLGTPVNVPTGGMESKEKIVKRITDSISQTIRELNVPIQEIIGIGIGSTGPVDSKAGIILECPQLPTMHFFELRKSMEDQFGVPVFLNNDANCLILAESIFGAAAEKNTVVGFTLGTGLGCAIVMNKKILNGSTGTAAEIWPSPYESGMIEDVVSGTGVSKIYHSISGLSGSSLEVYQKALNGDPAALQTWDEFGRHLAVPVAWTINLLDPEIVVLGGSIATAYPFFKNSMEENVRKWICPVPAEKTKIVVSTLGSYAGFIGAACLVIENKQTLTP